METKYFRSVIFSHSLHHSDLSSICGFSREAAIAITADVESRESKRITNMEEGVPPEHPRASTTDDVECFFQYSARLCGQAFYCGAGPI